MNLYRVTDGVYTACVRAKSAGAALDYAAADYFADFESCGCAGDNLTVSHADLDETIKFQSDEMHDDIECPYEISAKNLLARSIKEGRGEACVEWWNGDV